MCFNLLWSENLCSEMTTFHFMPFNFLKLPFTVCIGFVYFAEQPDLWTGLGAAVIFSSTYYIARREAKLNVSENAKPAPTL